MLLVNILRIINFSILIVYIYFLIARGIKFNLLTLIPIFMIFFYEVLGRCLVSKLKEKDEG